MRTKRKDENTNFWKVLHETCENEKLNLISAENFDASAGREVENWYEVLEGKGDDTLK